MQFPGQSRQPAIPVPKSGQELERLVERRDELKDQLETLNEQRSELAEQIQRIGPSEAAVRANPIARLQALDERIGRLEREQAMADDAIANAKTNGVSTDEANPGDPGRIVIPRIPRFDFGNWSTHEQAPVPWRDRALDSLLVTGPVTLASVVLVGAMIYWRLARSMKNQLAKLQASQAGALTELQRSVDTVAVEIERVSENQRFVTKLVGDKQAVERR
jgi:cell division septum initiation protein DivIVA